MAGGRVPDPVAEGFARSVIGAAIEVHRQLGPGYLESMYEQALCVELHLRSVPFVCQAPIDAHYKGYSIGQARLDLLVGEVLIVELKAVDALAPIHTAQLISYLKLTGNHLGLLINFNTRVLRDGLKRVVLD